MRHVRAFVIAPIVMMLMMPVATFAGGKQAGGDTAQIRPHPGGLVQAEWLKRRAIKDEQGRELGKIEEVWIDPKDGRVKEVIVSVGGFLGIGDKHRVLPWRDVNVTWEKQDLVVRVKESALRSAAEAGDRGSQPAASPGAGPKRQSVP